MKDFQIKTYQATMPCGQCGQTVMCLWQSEGGGRGKWICLNCLNPETDRLADMVKAKPSLTVGPLELDP